MELSEFYEQARGDLVKGEDNWFYAVCFTGKRKFPPKHVPRMGALWIEDMKTGYIKTSKGWKKIFITPDSIQYLYNGLQSMIHKNGFIRMDMFYDISCQGTFVFQVMSNGNVSISKHTAKRRI